MANNERESRRLRAGSNTVISILGAAVILVALNYLGMRHYVRGDWTSAGIYTLSDKSEKMLGTLKKDVQLYLLWSQGDPRFPDVKELVERYVGASSKVKMEILDQDLNPERVQWVIDRYGAKLRDMGDGTLAVEASIIVVSGDNIKFVSSAEFEDLQGDMFSQEAGGHEDELSGYKAEQSISSAILSVTSDSQQKVCFTQGHDEWPFEGFGGNSLGSIRSGLGQDGYKVEAIATASGSRIPSECNLVVVAGPKKAFLDDEAAKLGSYLEGGGRVLLLLDPIIEGDGFEVTGLEQLTAKHGIKLSRDIVFETDPRRLVSPSPFTFTASEFSTHNAVKQLTLPDAVGPEIKQQIGVYPVVFTMARSLILKESEGAIAEVLAKSSESSWGEVDLASMGAGEILPQKDQYDTNGPTIIAAAAVVGSAVGEKKAGRLAVIGDSDFLSEEFFLHSGLNNRDFWSGIVGWLTARADLISIAPKNPEHVRLNMTVDDVWTVRQVVGFEILFFIVLGVVVWIRRRS